MHLWLKYSVFLRLKDKEALKKFLSLFSKKLHFLVNVNPELITFMVSAFWHGFYPNYYTFFFFCFIIEQTSGILDSKTNYFKFIESFKEHKILPLRSIYYILGGLNLNIMNFFGIYFSLLFFDKAIILSNNLNWIPMIALLSVYGLCLTLFKKKKETPKTGETVIDAKANVKLEDLNSLSNSTKIEAAVDSKQKAE